MPEIEITNVSGVSKCTKCLRTKEQAIAEHLESMEPCDAFDCPFKYDIIDAIERKKHPPITIKGKIIKPKITIKRNA